ncbi:MAG: SPW repeat protein, partial [Xanthobacteraceae bacterium]
VLLRQQRRASGFLGEWRSDRAFSAAAIAAFSDWEEWLNLALGTSLASAPWLLGYAHTRAMHLSVGAGIIVVYLAGLRLWLMHYRERPSNKKQYHGH